MGNFDLDTPLYYFNNKDPFTIRQACEGVQIFGGIGSGKSSGSGAALAKAYLKAGFGGLVLCAKNDELETWKRYAQETGRENSLLVFDASGEFRFPFLEYEVTRKGKGAGYTGNLVRLFTTVIESMERTKGGGGDAYWMRAMEQLMRNAIDLCLIAEGTVSLPLIYELVMSAPSNPIIRDTSDWQKNSKCFQMLDSANTKTLDEWVAYDFQSTALYWMQEFCELAPKTRSGVLSMFTSMADSLLRRPFRMLFSEVPEDKRQILYPEYSHKGAIIVINLPVKEFGNAGKAAQMIYKYVWQQAAERRNIAENDRPVFLWIDEAQNFVSEYDMQFQATARSSRACTVYITQNLPNYYAEMGGEHSRHRVDSLVGNLQTKIWHANSDPETNNNAADIIGKDWLTYTTKSDSVTATSFTAGESQNRVYEYVLLPRDFTKLKKGGLPNNFIVEGYIFQNGRLWSNGNTFMRTKFSQT